MIVKTPVGRMRARARLDDGVRPDTVCAQYGWWEACPELGLSGYGSGGEPGVSYNAMISGEVFDPVSGSNALRAARCDLAAEHG